MDTIENNRRVDSDTRRLYDAIERIGKDCNDQHIETQSTLNDITNSQTIFAAKIQGIEGTLDRIGSKVDSTGERVASTETSVNFLKGQNSEQYGKIGKLETKVSALSGKGVESNPVIVSFLHGDNFKYAIAGGVFCVLMVLVAFGAITMQDVAKITPMAGGE